MMIGKNMKKGSVLFSKKEIKIKVVFFVIIYIFISAIAMSGYKKEVVPQSKNPTLVFSNMHREKKIKFEKLGKEITQKIYFTKDTDIDLIRLDSACYKENPKSRISIELKRKGKPVQTWECKFDDKNLVYFELVLDKPLKVNKNEKLELVIRNDGKYIPGTGALWKSVWDSPQTELYKDGKLSKYDLPMEVEGGNSKFILTWFWGIYFILSILYVVLCVYLLKNQWKVEQIFLCMGIVLGTLYAVVWVPYTCPDEYSHVSTAYYYSSKLLGEPAVNSDGNVLVRNEDLSYTGSEIWARKYSYYALEYNKNDVKNEKLVELDRWPLYAPATAYIPQILAITTVRLLHGSNIAWLILGRLFALITYCLGCYYALKKMPYAKWALAVLMLGPTALQEAASFSYDCTLNMCSFVFIAHVLNLAYVKEKVTKKDWIVPLVTGIIIAPIKVIYILLTLLIFLIPNKKISMEKQKAYLGKLAVFGAGIAAILIEKLSIIGTRLSTSTKNGMQGYSLKMILSNPKSTVLMWVNTVRLRSVFYLKQIFGGYEDYCRISISWLIIVGFYILLIFGLMVKEEEKILEWKGKIMSAVICIGMAFALLIAFHLDPTCTTVTSPNVVGIQGRYFLPFLPLLFMILQNKTVVLKKNIDTQLTIGIFVLQFWTLFDIFFMTISR